MSKRKTFDVETLRNKVNTMLKFGINNAEFRFGAATMLEEVLHSTGNYHGFVYLGESDVPSGELPGVRHDESGRVLDYPERFANTDESRRYYM